MDNHNIQEFLGVDVGTVRVGIARGNSAARISQPLKTVPADAAMNELKNLASKNQAAGIVVGLPRSLDGNETDQTRLVRQWLAIAKSQISLPFYWQDEALSSQTAETKNGSTDLDAKAAAVILQDFLDTKEDDRVAG